MVLQEVVLFRILQGAELDVRREVPVEMRQATIRDLECLQTTPRLQWIHLVTWPRKGGTWATRADSSVSLPRSDACMVVQLTSKYDSAVQQPDDLYSARYATTRRG